METGRKTLYSSVTKEGKKQIKMLGAMVIVMSVVVVCMVVYAFFLRGKPLKGFVLAVSVVLSTFLSLRILMNKGVRVFTNGILVPTGNMGLRRFIPFSNISEIRLNVGPETHHMDIEIQTIQGKVERFSKACLKNWDEFYRVLTEDLKNKVRVVV